MFSIISKTYVKCHLKAQSYLMSNCLSYQQINHSKQPKKPLPSICSNASSLLIDIPSKLSFIDTQNQQKSQTLTDDTYFQVLRDLIYNDRLIPLSIKDNKIDDMNYYHQLGQRAYKFGLKSQGVIDSIVRMFAEQKKFIRNYGIGVVFNDRIVKSKKSIILNSEFVIQNTQIDLYQKKLQRLKMDQKIHLIEQKVIRKVITTLGVELGYYSLHFTNMYISSIMVIFRYLLYQRPKISKYIIDFVKLLQPSLLCHNHIY